MNKHVKWLNRAVIVGVLINILGMALPFIFAPQWYLNWFGLPGGGGSVVWMRQAGLLLFFISILYVPGGNDPQRYRWNAIFGVLVRMTIGLYWLWLVFIEGRTRAFLAWPAPHDKCSIIGSTKNGSELSAAASNAGEIQGYSNDQNNRRAFTKTDGRTVILPRYTQPEEDHRLLLDALKLQFQLNLNPGLLLPENSQKFL
jgi:hypothetical protein